MASILGPQVSPRIQDREGVECPPRGQREGPESAGEHLGQAGLLGRFRRIRGHGSGLRFTADRPTKTYRPPTVSTMPDASRPFVAAAAAAPVFLAAMFA